MRKSSMTFLILGLAAGLAVGWILRGQRAESEARVVAVAGQLERVTFAAGTLMQLSAEAGKADDLQLMVLRSALAELEELSAERVELGSPVPSLREGLRRARSYAEANGMPELAETAAVVAERLFAEG